MLFLLALTFWFGCFILVWYYLNLGLKSYLTLQIIPHFTNPNTLRTCFIFECPIKFTMLCDTTPNNTSELTVWVRISLSFRLPACMFQFLIHRTLYGKRIFFYPLSLGRELQSETAGLSFCTRSPCYILHKFKVVFVATCPTRVRTEAGWVFCLHRG
jgi:hypothetical protein